MISRPSISLLFFCFAFGLLIGAAGLINFAYLSGYVDGEPGDKNSPGVSYTTAKERLENYNCRAGETKQIIFRGIEDNFSPEGVENAFIDPDQDKIIFDTIKNLSLRGYDETGQDKNFLDQFELPKRTFHGIVSIGIKELSSVRNDFIIFSFRSQKDATTGLADVSYSQPIAEMMKTGWSVDNAYHWASLEDLAVQVFDENGTQYSKDMPHFLSAIRKQQPEQDFLIRIGDDTMVDFVGFALCLEPPENKGVVFSNVDIRDRAVFKSLPADQVFLNIAVVNGESCNNKGCVSCDEKRPLVCIQDQNLPAPENLHKYLLGRWSGGNLSFTKSIPASMFETEDDVDAFCAGQFGAGWRHLHMKDGGWGASLVGYGSLPSGHSEFWVGVKNSPHHVCWDLRPDYEYLGSEEPSHD